jgi:hypothetical protein
MNQRIRELAEQAGFYYTDKTGFITPAGCNPAKFAELIVRECCQMMLDMETKYPANLTVREIKKHFGVEE